METLENYVRSAECTSTSQELRSCFENFLTRFDIEIFSYLKVVENLRSVPIELSAIWTNAPRNWIEAYVAEFFEVDPAARLSWQFGRPILSTELRQLIKLNRKQEAYIRFLRKMDIKFGMVVPVFGPRTNMSFFSFGSTDPDFLPSNDDIRILHMACQNTHLKYYSLAHKQHLNKSARLSRREAEVMSLVANGLSNAAIAKELEVSENTVDTMLRRAFKKLGVHNRISASVKAIGEGLILP